MSSIARKLRGPAKRWTLVSDSLTWRGFLYLMRASINGQNGTEDDTFRVGSKS